MSWPKLQWMKGRCISSLDFATATELKWTQWVKKSSYFKTTLSTRVTGFPLMQFPWCGFRLQLRDFIIWAVDYGLWSGLECEIKGSGPIMRNFWGPFFYFFGVKKNLIFLWKHYSVRTEKLHRKKGKKKNFW